MSMVWTSSTVRGMSLKLGSTTQEATTGSVTTYSVSWRWAAATRWDLTCRQVPMAVGTTPSTARSLYTTSRATTSFGYLGTRAMLAMLSLPTTGWCSPLMTATTTRGSIATTTTTAQCSTAVDSGTEDAPVPASTLSVDKEIASNGFHGSMEISSCRHLACGSRAKSSQWSDVVESTHLVRVLVHWFQVRVQLIINIHNETNVHCHNAYKVKIIVSLQFTAVKELNG